MKDVVCYHVSTGLALAGRRLDGLTDEEYWWEPVPGCWTVRRTEDAVAGVPVPGDWAIDGLWQYPDPPPFTTIAWRLNHTALVLSGYLGIMGAPITDERVRATATEAVEFWTEGAFTLDAAVKRWSEPELSEPVHVPHWGRAEPRWKIVDGIVRECVHHCAEVALLRDLHGHYAGGSNAT